MKRRYSVLIVDDAFFVRNLIKRAIGNKPSNRVDYEFETIGEALNGEEGLLLYKKLRPDVITIDVKMGSLGGIELIKKIREFDNDAQIIVISSSLDKNYKSKCEEINAYFIEKPFQDAYIWNRLDMIALNLKNKTPNEIDNKIEIKQVKETALKEKSMEETQKQIKEIPKKDTMPIEEMPKIENKKEINQQIKPEIKTQVKTENKQDKPFNNKKNKNKNKNKNKKEPTNKTIKENNLFDDFLVDVDELGSIFINNKTITTPKKEIKKTEKVKKEALEKEIDLKINIIKELEEVETIKKESDEINKGIEELDNTLILNTNNKEIPFSKTSNTDILHDNTKVLETNTQVLQNHTDVLEYDVNILEEEIEILEDDIIVETFNTKSIVNDDEQIIIEEEITIDDNFDIEEDLIIEEQVLETIETNSNPNEEIVIEEFELEENILSDDFSIDDVTKNDFDNIALIEDDFSISEENDFSIQDDDDLLIIDEEDESSKDSENNYNTDDDLLIIDDDFSMKNDFDIQSQNYEHKLDDKQELLDNLSYDIDKEISTFQRKEPIKKQTTDIFNQVANKIEKSQEVPIIKEVIEEKEVSINTNNNFDDFDDFDDFEFDVNSSSDDYSDKNDYSANKLELNEHEYNYNKTNNENLHNSVKIAPPTDDRLKEIYSSKMEKDYSIVYDDNKIENKPTVEIKKDSLFSRLFYKKK